MMRQDRFTEQAQEVLQASQEMVRQHRHSQWDVEHVLLGMLSHADGFARRILEKLGVNVDQLRDKVATHLGKAPKLGYDVVQIYTTPRIVRMLETAHAEAARLLREAGVDKERIYRALQEVRGTARVQSRTAEAHYQALEKYSVDLTEAARQGKLDPVIGREDEIQR